MEVRTFIGADLLERLGLELDELHAATGAPVTARRPWLAAWARCHPEYEPLALLVQDGPRLEAAALLVRRKARVVSEFFALGTGLSDQARLPARNPAAAARLAHAVLEHLSSVRGPWHLRLRHLPPDDAVATAIAAGLDSAELAPGDPSPTLRFGPERLLRAHVSKNHHQQVRRMLNRMQGEGLAPELAHLRARAAVAAVLPEVEAVCLRRDVELRGMSLFDRAGARAFFREVILEHAARGELELTTLNLRGRLAAYVVCFLDRGAHRMWNCRLDPAWSRYGVGRVANNAALERALADPGADEFDWMRGDEAYKLSMSNHVERALDLWAWSTPALRVALDSKRRLKGFVKGVVAEHEWLQPAFAASRRLKSAGRRAKRSVA
ncbi:MAG: GNAT family N-acetyltransferase, partial [Planctomycetes bacterium]|nr:GNAT family N-acetyltransferase [Planctomycetota bacterium]